MTHRYTAAHDGWFALITPARQLFVGGSPEPEMIARLWARIRDEQGPAGVLETLAEGGLFATPPFVFVEQGDSDAEVIVRGDAVVRVGGDEVSGSGATTWIERRLPGTEVTVELTSGGELELPIEAGVVRAAAFTSGTGSLATRKASDAVPAAVVEVAPVPAPAAEPEPTPAPAPEAPDDDIDGATISLAQFLADEEARSAAAAPSTPARLSEETVMELPDAPAAPATSPAAAAAPGATPASESGGDAYDYLFGETVFHNVQDAVVHQAEPDEEGTPETNTVEPPLAEGDHDGSTVLTSPLSRSGRVRRQRSESAAPAAPAVTVVLPGGAREVLDEALILGRSPSVAGVPGGQLPRLVTLTGGDQDISRSHVRIALEGGTVVVTDLHSRNGTSIVLPSGETQKLRAGDPTPVIIGTLVDLGGGIELRLEEL